MQPYEAKKLVQDTLERSFDKECFVRLTSNMLKHAEPAPFSYTGPLLDEAFKAFADHIKCLERVFKYTNTESEGIDVLIVYLKKVTALERARTMQRNFVSKYLNGGSNGVTLIDAALVAFVAPNNDWRFSFVKMEYKRGEQGKTQEVFTPARRYSFLVGEDEKSHTAQSCLLPVLCAAKDPTLKEVEEAFSVERVTQAFFEKYQTLFFSLEESLAGLVEKDAKIKDEFETRGIHRADFCKKLLGQIVFLYFLQKKGWFGVARDREWGSGSRHFLRDLFTKRAEQNFFKKILEPLFYEVLNVERPGDWYSPFDSRIPFLNGGLFEPIKGYKWENVDMLLPDDLFSNHEKTPEGDTGTGILDVFDRYNFTVKEDEPLEKEVAIDPEMLGKVFENLLNIQDRKSTGTYYTPREVVHYMCQESLVHYLVSELSHKVPEEDIEKFVKQAESTVPQNIPEHARLINEKLKNIRVCDPAVGSGAFVVGMMQEIIHLRAALYPHIEEGARVSEQILYDFKRHAIQNCLYGVDNASGAVEIAKLRLWLSLVVDEQERETVKPLPNLDYKIIQGDALLRIKRDLWNNELFVQLEQLKKPYFDETRLSKKQADREEINRLIKAISGEDFDLKIYCSEVFSEKKGFDVLIGNPPYIQLQKEGGKLGKKYENEGYDTFARTGDIYQLFYERGHKLLNDSGRLCFITSNKWMRAGYGKQTRNYFSQKTQPARLIDLGPDVFETATVDSNILLFGKRPAGAELKAAALSKKAASPGLSKLSLRPLPVPKKDEPWVILSPAEYALKQKIEKIGTPLKLWEVSICFGIKTGYNEAFIIDRATQERLCQEDPKSAEILKPVLRGKDIKRYRHQWAGLWLITTHNGYKDESGRVPPIDINHYPAVKAHLDKHWERVEKRLDQGNTPYNLRDCAYHAEFEKEKVVYPIVTEFFHFIYDSRSYYANDKCYIITGEKLKYLCGFFNSTISFNWIRDNCAVLGKGGRELRKIFFENIPVPPVTADNRAIVEQIEDLVNVILDIKVMDPHADTHEPEQQINKLVYQLYDLTEEEISVVERR